MLINIICPQESTTKEEETVEYSYRYRTNRIVVLHPLTPRLQIKRRNPFVENVALRSIVFESVGSSLEIVKLEKRIWKELCSN